MCKTLLLGDEKQSMASLHQRSGGAAMTGASILILLFRVDCNDGVASYLESLATGLRDAGDRVVIISGAVTTLYGSESRQRAIAAAVDEWIVLENFHAKRPRLAHLRTILRVVRRLNIDVISPQGFAAVPLGFAVARLSNRPLVTNYHPSVHGDDAATVSNRVSPWKRVAYRLLNRVCRSDRYIALSSDIETFFVADCRISRRLIHKQVLGVDTQFFHEPTGEERERARSEFSIPQDALTAVLPGRLNVNKGHALAASAVRLLRARRPEITLRCLFPGGGDQREQIERLVIQDDRDRATFLFLGFVNNETLRATYWAADVVLLPSRVEGFGLVVAEAMCCGAIAVRTPSGGWKDQVVEGVTGFVVPFDDAEALASCVETIFDSPNRDLMRRSAMEHASRMFAKSVMIAGTSALYRDVARRRGR